MALKGEDKGIQAENMRELKNKGLSERDAVLVSMKNTPKKKKSKNSEMTCGPCDSSEAFPYGLRVDLNNDSLEKLGIDALPKSGKTMKMVAEVKVESTSERQERDGTSNRSVGLQITKMKLG